MRNILGFGVVLAVVSLTAAFETAYGQSGAGGQAGRGGAGAGGRAASTAGNIEQQVTNAVGANNQTGATNAMPGQPATSTPAPGVPTTAPANTNPVPGTAGNVVNPVGGTPTYPGSTTPGMVSPAAPSTTTYSSNYYGPGAQQGAYPATGTGMTPGYNTRAMPGMAGYNSVNPMGTTMAPGYYYPGTAGRPYATGATTRYSPMYAAPGYYTMQPQTYPFQQRRGLFGGLFRRRGRMVYPASPYGTTYGTYPSGYTTTGYTTVTSPGTYVYSTSPY